MAAENRSFLGFKQSRYTVGQKADKSAYFSVRQMVDQIPDGSLDGWPGANACGDNCPFVYEGAADRSITNGGRDVSRRGFTVSQGRGFSSNNSSQ